MTATPPTGENVGQRFVRIFRRLLSQGRWVLSLSFVCGCGIAVLIAVFSPETGGNRFGTLLLVGGVAVAVTLGLPVTFLVMAAVIECVVEMIPTPSRDSSTWGPWRRWAEQHLTEENVIAAVLVMSGPICLAISLASFFGHTPEYLDTHRWGLPAVTSFGLFWLGYVFGGGAYTVYRVAVGEHEPTGSLSAGQFALTFVGLLLLAVLGTLSFAGLFVAMQVLTASLDAARHSTLVAVLPWGQWIVCGLGIAYVAVLVPGYALIKWLGQRRALDKMRTEALLTLAAAVEKASHGRQST